MAVALVGGKTGRLAACHPGVSVNPSVATSE
jgi:hypothetical protein